MSRERARRVAYAALRGRAATRWPEISRERSRAASARRKTNTARRSTHNRSMRYKSNRQPPTEQLPRNRKLHRRSPWHPSNRRRAAAAPPPRPMWRSLRRWSAPAAPAAAALHTLHLPAAARLRTRVATERPLAQVLARAQRGRRASLTLRKRRPGVARMLARLHRFVAPRGARSALCCPSCAVLARIVSRHRQRCVSGVAEHTHPFGGARTSAHPGLCACVAERRVVRSTGACTRRSPAESEACRMMSRGLDSGANL